MKKLIYGLLLLAGVVLLSGCSLRDNITKLIGKDSEYQDIYHDASTDTSTPTSSSSSKSRINESEYGVVSYHVYDGDRYYTVRENDPVFGECETDEDILLIDTSDKTEADFDTFYLSRNVMSKEYIKVSLPSKYTYYVTDNSIYSLTGEIRVEVYDGLVGSDLNAGNSIVYDKNTKYTKNGGKSSHIIVREFDNGYTLRAEVNSNSEDWSMVVKSVIDMTEDFTYPTFDVIKSTSEPATSSEFIQSIYLTNDYYRTAKFEDGYLNLTNSAYTDSNNIEAAKAWVFTRNVNQKIEYYEYDADNVYILWSNDGYEVAVFKNNKDFSFVLYGYGEEALVNIMEIVKHEAK